MDIRKCILKITIENSNNDIESATGFLIPNNQENNFIIITVSHLFENYNHQSKISIHSLVQSDCYFNIQDILYFKKEKYAPDEDVAVIIVDKVDWLTDDDVFLISYEKPETKQSKVSIVGFPKSIEERSLDISHLCISGSITSYDNNIYTVYVGNINEPGISLYDSIKGVSGAPVYSISNNKYILWGIQKGVPDKEFSYNTLNILSIHRCLEVVKDKFNLKITFNIYDPILKRCKQIFEDYSNNCGTYYLKELNANLFPKIKENIDMLYYDKANTGAPLITYLEQKWYNTKSSKEDIIVIGEGGYGKTVTLFEACKYFLSKGEYSIYIPLHMIDDKFYKTIESYIINKIWVGNESKFTSFKEDLLSYDHVMNIIIILDGFNEVKNQNKPKIVSEILYWRSFPNVRIIMSSRYDFTNSFKAFENMLRLTIQPLSIHQINAYLKECEINLPMNKNDKLFDILQTPLMLILYSLSEKFKVHTDNSSGIKRKAICNNCGSILWNYVQSHYRKSLLQNDEPIEYLYLVFTFEYISTYISRFMEKKDIFLLKEEEFFGLIMEAIQYYNTNWQDSPNNIIHRIEREYECKVDQWKEEKVYSILTKQLHLFIITEDNVTLIHQQFRDFLSAFFYIKKIIDSDAVEYWSIEPINHYVVNFISEIIDDFELNSMWEKVRGREISKGDYVISNLINIYKKINSKNKMIDFSKMSFDKIDLRCTSLSGLELTGIHTNASFKNAKISQYTLFPKGHSGSIYCLAVSQDGTKLITGSGDRTVREWDLRSGECISIMLGHLSYVYSIDYSQDTGMAVSGSYRGDIILWNLNERLILKKLSGHTKTVYGIKFLRNSQKVISISYDTTIRLWDIFTGNCEMQIATKGEGLRCLDVSEINNKVVVGSYDGTMSEWDLLSGKLISKFSLNNGPIRTIAYSANGESILAGCENGYICEIHPLTNEITHNFNAHEQKISSLAYSQNEDNIVSCSYDCSIKVWDLQNEVLLSKIDTSSSRYCATFLPSKNMLIEAGADGNFTVWNYCTNEKLLMVEGGLYGFIYVDYFFSEEYFLVINKDHRLKLWNYHGELLFTTIIEMIESYYHKIEIFDVSESDHLILLKNANFLQIYDFQEHTIEDFMNNSECVKSIFAFTDTIFFLVRKLNQFGQLYFCKYKDEPKTNQHINFANVHDFFYSKKYNIVIAFSKYKIVKISENGDCESILETKTQIKYARLIENESKIIVWLESNSICHVDILSKKVVENFFYKKDHIKSFSFSKYGDKAILFDDKELCEINLRTNQMSKLSIAESFNVIGIQYYDNDQKCIIIDENGNIVFYNLFSHSIEKDIYNINGIDIYNCNFTGAIFENDELLSLVKMCGGII